MLICADLDDSIMDVYAFDDDNQGFYSTQNSFQLEPFDYGAIQKERKVHHVNKNSRNRKLLIDEQKQISGDDMKANMIDYRCYFY